MTLRILMDDRHHASFAKRTSLEDAARTAQRVIGGAHPTAAELRCACERPPLPRNRERKVNLIMGLGRPARNKTVRHSVTSTYFAAPVLGVVDELLTAITRSDPRLTTACSIDDA